MDPFFHTGLSISDSLKTVRKSVLIYETIIIKRGFLYLTAVIDWYNRCIVGWEVDDTLDTRMVISALKKAFLIFSSMYSGSVVKTKI